MSIVRKVLKQDTEYDLSEIEQRNLALLRHIQHPNIVELLGSYTHRKTYNLLFPLAKDGDLAQLLSSNRKSPFPSDTVIYTALCGLSAALNSVHNYASQNIQLDLIGCHHDLNPRNILVHENRFILADFGLAKFKSLSEDSKTDFEVGNGYYVAPECEDLEGFQRLRVGRASDIWSFGCIIAEVITFMLRGSDGVLQFRNARRAQMGRYVTYYFHAGPNKSNPAVERWLSESEAILDDDGKMLLELVKKMLALKPSDRPKALDVMAELSLISVYSISRSTTQLFDEFSTQNRTVGAEIEKERFKTWWHFLNRIQQDDRLAELFNSSERYDEIRLILEEVETELRKGLKDNCDRIYPLVRVLQGLNDRLHNILPSDVQSTARQHCEIKLLNLCEQERFDEIQESFPDSSYYERLMTLTTIKRMTTMFNQRKHLTRSDLVIDKDKIKILSNLNGKLHNVQMANQLAPAGVSHPKLIEWVEYESHWDYFIGQELLIRIEVITELLNDLASPEEFRVLHCSGYFHDPSRHSFGLVYDFPCHVANLEISQPRTLNEIISQAKQGKSLPSFEDRLRLSTYLAETLSEFHKVGWLHKRLSSFTVLFFLSERAALDISSPFLIGFSNSRPNEPSAFTEGYNDYTELMDYYHPNYLKKTTHTAFSLEYDYYSLGLILLEIGLWKTLKDFTANWGTISPFKLYECIIKRRLPLLQHTMGKRYYNAVKFCLSGFTDGIEESSHLKFEANVVEPLRAYQRFFG